MLLGGLEGNQSSMSSGLLGGSQMYVPETTPRDPQRNATPPAMTTTQMWNKMRWFGFIAGITRDANGNPLAGVEVRLFDGANDYQGNQFSAADGSYRFLVFLNVNNATLRTTGGYLVAWLAGAPDVAGVTDKNIFLA